MAHHLTDRCSLIIPDDLLQVAQQYGVEARVNNYKGEREGKLWHEQKKSRAVVSKAMWQMLPQGRNRSKTQLGHEAGKCNLKGQLKAQRQRQQPSFLQ